MVKGGKTDVGMKRRRGGRGRNVRTGRECESDAVAYKEDRCH